MHIRKGYASLWRKKAFQKTQSHPKSCGNGSYLTLKRGKLQETGQKTEGNTYRTRPRISIKGDGRTKSDSKAKKPPWTCPAYEDMVSRAISRFIERDVSG